MKESAPTIVDYARPPRARAWRAPDPLVLLIVATVMAVAGTLALLWGARLPVSNAGLMLVGTFLHAGAIVGWAWALGFPLARMIRRRPRGERTPVRRWLASLIVPTLFFATLAVLRAERPRRVTFTLNKPAMDRWVAAEMAAGGLRRPPTARIGHFEVYRIESIPGGRRFFVAGAGFFRYGGGFAYSPGAFPPPSRGGAFERYRPAGGGWYYWEYDGG